MAEGHRQADGVIEISAEKGYLREFGNIVFHFFAARPAGRDRAGQVVRLRGQRHRDRQRRAWFLFGSPAAYDSFRAGNNVDGTRLYPMCVRVNDFQADYLPSGQATYFAADIDYQAGADLTDDVWRPYRLEVNHPLRVGGDRVYLQGHGYAPTFTVTFPGGQQRTQTVQFQPDNAQTLLSRHLAVRPAGGLYPGDERRKHQIAITGLFAPTAQMDGKLLSSSFPAMNDPAVAIDIYRGDAGLDTGRPQSLFQLDTRLVEQKRLTKVKADQPDPRPGGPPRRRNRGAFRRSDPFVNLQVSHDPGQVWVLVSALAMMAGLMVSLIVRRRRVWARITPAGGEAGATPG